MNLQVAVKQKGYLISWTRVWITPGIINWNYAKTACWTYCWLAWLSRFFRQCNWTKFQNLGQYHISLLPSWWSPPLLLGFVPAQVLAEVQETHPIGAWEANLVIRGNILSPPSLPICPARWIQYAPFWWSCIGAGKNSIELIKSCNMM